MIRPSNIGILSIQSYIPGTYIDQSELEVYDNVSKGKYTIGLGQQSLSCTSDLEDINSICSTVLVSLLEKNHVNPAHIGRLEVGTETIQDKSKSSKTFLMDFFKGNPNIEGVTTYNACYGGTQALFNTVAWVESSAWDGRLGIVIVADIAVYAPGTARATGGAGAVALLIGPNAPMVLDSLRVTHMAHVFDFFKPMGRGEYPVVDGTLSIDSYLEALNYCYKGLKERVGAKRLEGVADFYCFHSPYNKLVRKAFNYLLLQDYL